MQQRDVEFFTETITLGKFLKWAGVAETGHNCTELITAGNVKVNGTVERRRGRTLRDGDRVECCGALLVAVHQPE